MRGYVKDLKTYYGIWTLNLTHVATVELPHRFLGATPVFDNNMLYLFTVEKSNSTYNLIESKYHLNGTLVWRRKVGKLKFEELPEPSNNCVISGGENVLPIILPYSNVYVGVYLVGKAVNVVAVDFKDAIPPLANASITLPVTYNEWGGCSVGFMYDNKYIEAGSEVYSINTTAIPSAVIVDSNLPANVTVDGKWSGKTPFYLNVEPGRHRVEIVRRNYSPPIERVVRVGSHEGVRVFATLTPLNATVVLTSTPTAEVDILPAGITVNTPSNVSLRNGTYTLIFKSKEYPGQYERIRKTVTLLPPNETRTINVELSLIRSELNINSTVENATVYIDGKMVGGNSPLQVFVVPGSHNVTLKAQGYLPESVEINATRPVLNVSVALTPVTDSNRDETFSSPTTATPSITHSSTSLKPTETESKKDTHSTCGPGFMVFLSITAVFALRRRNGSK
ncbi:PEGA domain-containing protein [Thermococcus peptonophilus]|uniref:PEGA domain-containing protein n=1 Tax=Thermococcus peptonophilus TaxID=53952 RepID=UPI00346744EE